MASPGFWRRRQRSTARGSRPTRSATSTSTVANCVTPTAKLVMFLAIDRVSKFTYVEFHDSAGKMDGSAFLKVVVEVFPYKIHTMLTYNGTAFADLPKIREGPSRRFPGPHIFDRVCMANAIEHRLTKPYPPWTTDVIDKCFLAGSELFSSRAWVTAWRRAGREAQVLPRSLHRGASVGGACAHPLGTTRIPTGDEASVSRLGLLDPSTLLIA